MKARNILLIGAVAAMFTAGASAAYVGGVVPNGANTLVTAMKADEGVPQNLVTALKADEGVPQNLVTCDDNGLTKCTFHNVMAALPASEAAHLDLVVAMKADEGVPHNLVTA